MNRKKYEITEVAHPKYPWLHRIRALCQVNEQVSPGMLGGYVQTEDNLSQEGTCWIYDQAICCEEAVVTSDGRMYGESIARDSALVGGDARLFDRAKAEGNSCILSGEFREEARAAGEAVINKADNGESPRAIRHSNIYGTVCGRCVVYGTIMPGEKLINSTPDIFIIETGKRMVLAVPRKLENPRQKRKERNREEDRER